METPIPPPLTSFELRKFQTDLSTLNVLLHRIRDGQFKGLYMHLHPLAFLSSPPSHPIIQSNPDEVLINSIQFNQIRSQLVQDALFPPFMFIFTYSRYSIT